MSFNFQGKTFNYKNRFGYKHSISKINRNKKGFGTATVWTSGDVLQYFDFTLLSDNTYSIKAKDVTNIPSEVILPRTYNGKLVTTIADRAFMDIDLSTGTLNGTCTTITSVVVPNTYTTIGEAAFAHCSNLEIIDLPDTITTIKLGAFQSLPKLKCIYLSASVTEVRGNIFNNSDNLTIYCRLDSKPSGWNSYWNPDNLPVVWGYNPMTNQYLTFTELEDGTYSVKAKDVANLYSNISIPFTYNGKAVTKIESNAFKGCSIGMDVIIPNTITSIGDSAFYNCPYLDSVVLPKGITVIDNYTFGGCASLTEINIPEGITSIGYASFGGCTNIVNVNLPASVTSIGEQAFNGCSSLATFTIADNSQLASIGEYAFNYCSALTSIVIPASVTTIGAYAFRNCDNLTINCEAASKPSGWASTWVVIKAGGNCTVNWGYTS